MSTSTGLPAVFATCIAVATMGCAAPTPTASGGSATGERSKLPARAFTNAPARPHGHDDLIFSFDQLEYYYRVPGEFTHRLNGDEYGFAALSFIITETHPGGGPGLHVHDTEEAHVLLKGTAQYRVGEKTFTVQAPYVARVPAGVPHSFINAGTTAFNLIAVFPSKHPGTRRLGPNPLIPVGEDREEPKTGPIP
jgi:mannose-6-phosphate isomerase-like protein (cupin superfamily)